MAQTFITSAPTQFNLIEATVDEITKAFEFGALTAEELVQLYRNRIEAYDDSGPKLNSIINLNPNALEIAREIDRERFVGKDLGALAGIPVLLKDNYDTFDVPTTGGSDALAGSVPPDDAFAVANLRDAGAVIFGKANLDEFAISGQGYGSLEGQVLDPYQLNRQSGGSSGGTGAAIAANFATVGTGSDTGGSIRTPSSFQGLVGVRPTRGLVSTDGIIPFTPSRDMGGPMARTVTDAAITLGAMVGFDPDNPSTSTKIAPPTVRRDRFYKDYTQFLDLDDLEGARLGVVSNFFGDAADPEVNRLAEEALNEMEELGATTVDISFDESFLSDVDITYGTATEAELKPYFDDYLATLGAEYPKTVEELIAVLESPEIANSETPSTIVDTLRSSLSGSLSAPDYLDVAENVTPSIRNTLLEVLDSNDLDAFVFPTIGTFARPLPETTDPTFVSPLEDPPTRQVELASSTGLPDVTVPTGTSEGGLPVTMSFTGRPYSEPTILGLAYSYEQATKFRVAPESTPPLPGEEFEYLTEVTVYGDAEDDEIAPELLADFDGNGDLVFAGAGEDLVDTSQALTGSNRIYGGAGDDEVIVGIEDFAVGGKGDDLLDASVGRGKNRLYGGAGKDEFFLGSGDRAFGGSGNDSFFVLAGGNNSLTGGAGADRFWIANAELPTSANTIADFTPGEDVIGLGGLNLSFEDFNLRQDGSDTTLNAFERDLAVLSGINANDLSADNFVFANEALG
ncbi:amidase family protein [Myxosarcina sp. GI1]|uniref:amidase family protein n=1 Tax=Myxosarcina sp. GI1 TaxID=1541065 RepID=UPI00068EB283|nr:amidase family protein [Myxosarcina sp. GI1]